MIKAEEELLIQVSKFVDKVSKAYIKLEERYNKLYRDFEDYKENSINWCVEDFTQRAKENRQDEKLEDRVYLSKEQAKIALADMMRHHDCNYGITWDTLDYYIQLYGSKGGPRKISKKAGK